MRRTLATLQRVRTAQKKSAKQDFAEAERSRLQQEEKVEGLTDRMHASYGGGDGFKDGEAYLLAQEQSYRVRMQEVLQEENEELNKRAVKSTEKRSKLREADRDHRVVELALERLDELLSAYGADEAGWPAGERQAARELIAASAEARRLLEDARALDTLLSAAPVEEPSEELVEPTPNRPK